MGVCVAIVMGGWHYLYEIPRIERQISITTASQHIEHDGVKSIKKIEDGIENISMVSDRIINFKNAKITGSLRTNGLIIGNIILHDYKSNVKGEDPIQVLSMPNGEFPYYMSFGWISEDLNGKMIPNEYTSWDVKIDQDNHNYCEQCNISMSWDNKNGQIFYVGLRVDDNYMMKVTQGVKNYSNNEIKVSQYAFLKKSNVLLDSDMLLHRGPIGVINNAFKEVSYQDVQKAKHIEYNDQKNGWVGISGKYWLSAIIPHYEDHVKSPEYDLVMRYDDAKKENNIQLEMLDSTVKIPSHSDYTKSGATYRIFVGPKDIGILDKYADELGVRLFDRAMDLGVMYFLTKPMLLFLRFINNHITFNYGFAIILLTLCVKLLLWPLSKKSYTSMAKMKTLQPKMTEIRTQYAKDKAGMNHAIIELYKREKVNPLAGILPMLIQGFIFFCLYKVLYVSIDMRHSPFIFWIKDLSSPDPTSIFNLFGLLPFEVHKLLRVGVFPIVLGFTTWLQQKMGTPIADPAQARVMMWLPVIFTFLFANFAVGLMVYWIVSNVCSIIQQYLISRLHSNA